MYGHIETLEERIEHMLIIREIQKETGGITEFVPLPFMPYNNPIGEKLIKEGRYATPGLEDLKTYAISRILLKRACRQYSGKLGKVREKACPICSSLWS